MEVERPKSERAAARPGSRLSIGVASVALLCAMLGGGDSPSGVVFASGSCTAASPGAMDYCASTKCGPCADGEGDCDPGQCQSGLTCVEEGSVDHCRPTGCTAPPGAMDYCSTSQCGPCGD